MQSAGMKVCVFRFGLRVTTFRLVLLSTGCLAPPLEFFRPNLHKNLTLRSSWFYPLGRSVPCGFPPVGSTLAIFLSFLFLGFVPA